MIQVIFTISKMSHQGDVVGCPSIIHPSIHLPIYQSHLVMYLSISSQAMETRHQQAGSGSVAPKQIQVHRHLHTHTNRHTHTFLYSTSW